ncbi:MAG: carbohydrate kinase [Firmicutes bacterium]|nr:carbohydrate kinase [Bacillota bacterium]
MEYLLGLDIGTTHLKAGLFTLQGEAAAVKLASTPSRDLGGGRAVYDPEELWGRVSGLLREITGMLQPEDRILSIGIASMGEAGLLLDAEGKPLTPIIAWYDSRGEEVAGWIDSFGAGRILEITGLSPDYIYSLLKLLWLKTNEPETVSRAKKWLCMMDYIIYRLTGEFATDYSIATRTMLFDINRKAWSEEIAQAAGLDLDLMPKAYPGGTVVGQVTESASQSTGLERGVPVCTGGHDHLCGAFAVGVFEPGKVLDSMGTAESLVAAYSKIPRLTPDVIKGFGVGCHVVKDAYYLLGGIHASGLCVEWFRREFSSPEQSLAEERGVSIYDILVEAADKSPVGAQGLMFIPHLRGAGPSDTNPHSRAAFLGIREYHERKDHVRAILEGLACEFAYTLRSSQDILGLDVSKIQAIGGGTKNRLWMEIKAAVLNMPIEIPAVQESTLLGAALLGGLGAGVYRDEYEALSETYRVLYTYEPDPKLVEQYRDLYEAYCRVLPLAGEISRVIASYQA